MKILTFLYLFIIFFMYVEIKANAQKPVQVIVPEQATTDPYANVQKGEKDTARQKEVIIRRKQLGESQKELQKEQLDRQKEQFERLIKQLDKQKEQLDRQKEFKDLQSFDQLNIPLVPPIPDQQDLKILRFGGLMGGTKDLSELRLNKSFKGESIETTKKFSVTADNISLNFNLSGQVKSGVISVTLFKPNGSKYKSIEIDPTSDVSFSQGIDLKKDSKEWTGDWQIKIQAEKADGSYQLTILTK